VYVISKVIDKLKFEYRRNAARQQQQQRRNSSSNGTGASGSGIRGRTWGGS
jgi:hypothetical protein